MNHRRFVLVVIFMALWVSAFSQTGKSSLVSALSRITDDYDKRAELIAFVKGILQHKGIIYYEEEPYEYHGVDYSYDVNGKFLFVSEEEYGAGASSYSDTTSYIIDTELKKNIPINTLFMNLSDPSFYQLVIKYLSKDKNYDWIVQSSLRESIQNHTFNVFYGNNGVGMHWGRDRNAIGDSHATGGPFDIILPYSRVQNYLTPLGKEVFKKAR